MADFNYMEVASKNKEETYFALREAKDCASACLAKSQSFFNLLRSNNYLFKLQRMWHAYHGSYTQDLGFGHAINFTGEQGELVQLPVNHFRNLAQHILVMVTANRPTMEARAVNTDYKSLAQTYLANGILDYYMREKRLEDYIKQATELAIVLGAGFIKMEWNATAGEAFDTDPDTGEIIYEGELAFSVLSPFDVVMDGTRETWENDWLMTRSFKNRYDLVAKYPEHADKIKALPTKSQSSVYRLAVWSNDDTDDIAVYEFYHKRTESMPEGRYLLFLESDIVLLDAKLPYRTIPIFRIAPSTILGTPYGYTPMFDVFPIQEGINSLYSTIMTNNNAFGVQNIWVPKGSDIAVSNIEGALNIVESAQKPEPIQLTQTAPETFQFLEMLIQSAETISGVNSVARGNPEASLKSGTALALVQSMALQFISGLQNSYVKMVEDVGTSLINILKDYATTPKTIAVVGKHNRTLLKEFTGEKISAINRVIVDIGNPLARCLAKDTPILMYDGTVKMVQDIKIGNEIMGPDSCPRTVTNINSGQEMMYEVVSKDKHRNVKYGCNENHILTLRYCSDDERYDAQQGDIIDISVKDYLELTNRQKRLLQGFTVGVEFEEKELAIPPYILGAWLGDGTSATTALTNMDSEIITEWKNYAESIGMKIREQEIRQPNKAKTYFITSGKASGEPDRNIMMNHLRGYELINNKHIPEMYLTSSRRDRLELLAGLIDTDGSRIDETLIFVQKNERLANDVVRLAKSLGFRTTIKKFKSNSSKLVGTLNSECHKISIGGDTYEIPMRTIRKKCKQKEKARNPLNYGIEVTPIGLGTYYGFTLEEDPHFLLGDFTVTHNTTSGRVQMAEQMLQMGAIQTPEQYFQVLNTGRIDSMFEGTESELLRIKQENEDLSENGNVLASPLDRHRMHIIEHRMVISDPDLRRDPQLVKVVMDHISEHLNYLRTTPPELLQIIGEQPLMPPQPSMMPGQPGGPGASPEQMGGPPGAPPNPGAPGSADAQMQATQTYPNLRAQITGQLTPSPTNMPNLPKPPGEFANSPVLASDLAPPIPR